METAYKADPKQEQENTDDEIRVARSETAAKTAQTRTTEEVRQGHTGDHLRYILLTSIAGIVAIFLVIYMLFMQ